MKHSNNLWVTVVILLALFSSNSVGQISTEKKYDPNRTVLALLEAAVHAKYGNEYEVGFHIMDSLLVHSQSEEITDPYGTLKGCVLFSAWRPLQEEKERDSIVTGMYKGGQIIWDDYPGTKAGFGGALLTTQDINNDGEVDILAPRTDFNLMTREGSGISYLWILSWNGTRGRMINDIDPATGQSTVVSIEDLYELIDVDRDGVLEIRGEISDIWQEYFLNHNPPTLPKITYGWNGTAYGFWPTVRQVPENEFLPANDLQVSLYCKVSKSADGYVFDYMCSNGPSSKQGVQYIYIGGLDDTSSNYTPPEWEASSSRYLGGRLFCSAHIDLEYTIRPGYSLQGLQTISPARPTIVRYYVQGLRTSTPSLSDDQYRNDILTNSVSGYTIGTSDTTQSFVSLNFVDTLSSYTSRSRTQGWIKDQATSDKYVGYFTSARTSLQQNNVASTRATLQQVLQDVNVDSTAKLTSEAYALIRYNTEYLVAQLPAAPPPGLNVKLINSAGTKLTGGSLQYYDGSWKDATNNNDGTFSITTSQKTLSLRMTYEFATQTKSNVTVGYDTVTFQTVNAQIKLQSSQGAPIDTGTVQYYFSSWKTLGATSNGVVSKELLSGNYTFRMTYASATNDKQQDIGANPVVIFQTVNAAVQLKNSQGALMDLGTVQYYFSSWKSFGVTTGGVATKELLPGNYTFRMSYAAATNDKQQNIGTNATVVFQTVNATVQLKNSQGSFIDQGTVQYYFSSWNAFGSTTSGVATKELLPGNYTFRMTYAAATNDKQQNIGTNATVVFQTVNATVQLKNSQGSFIDQGTVQYYFSSWNSFGATTNGVATKELLPGNYTFRMTYAAATNDKQQNIGTNPTVLFQTVNATVRLQNSLGSPIDQGTVQYYFNSWNSLGATANGVAAKELLPGNYTFRMTYESATNDKQQNIGANPTVVFQTVNAIVQLRNSLGAPIDTGRVQYYFSSWRDLGTTSNGVAAKELLPANYTFRMTHESVTNDKVQNISTNNTVTFSTVLCTVSVKNGQNQPVDNAMISFYFNAWRQIGPTVNGQVTKELLSANLTFRMTLGTVSQNKAQNIGTNGTVEFVTQ